MSVLLRAGGPGTAGEGCDLWPDLRNGRKTQGAVCPAAKGPILAELFPSSACARRGVELGSYLWYTYIVDIPYMCIHWISFLLGCRPVGQKPRFSTSSLLVPLGGGGEGFSGLLGAPAHPRQFSKRLASLATNAKLLWVRCRLRRPAIWALMRARPPFSFLNQGGVLPP